MAPPAPQEQEEGKHHRRSGTCHCVSRHHVGRDLDNPHVVHEGPKEPPRPRPASNSTFRSRRRYDRHRLKQKAQRLRSPFWQLRSSRGDRSGQNDVPTPGPDLHRPPGVGWTYQDVRYILVTTQAGHRLAPRDVTYPGGATRGHPLMTPEARGVPPLTDCSGRRRAKAGREGKWGLTNEPEREVAQRERGKKEPRGNLNGHN